MNSPDISYSELLSKLKGKYVFRKTEFAMESFKKYFSRSKKFVSLFVVNFMTLSVLFLFGVSRYCLGIARDKPVALMAVVLIVLLIVFCRHLYRLDTYIGAVALPEYYREQVPESQSSGGNWEWDYYWLGTAVFVSAFVPIAGSRASNNESGGGGDASGGSGCSNSCGSSCGSGCGGCGGD